jgi:hypothetical protein
MTKPVTAGGAWIVAVVPLLEHLLVDEAGVEVVVDVLVQIGVDHGCFQAAVLSDAPVPAPVSVAVLLGCSLGRGDELRQHARERVDLVSSQLGSRCGSYRIPSQDTFEPEHEAVAHLPAGRGLGEPGRYLFEGMVECGSACGTGRERDGGFLPVVQERLAEPRLGSAGGLDQIRLGVRRQRRRGLCFVHARSTYCRAAPSEGWRSRDVVASVTGRAYLRNRRYRRVSGRRQLWTPGPISDSGRPTIRVDTPLWSGAS